MTVYACDGHEDIPYLSLVDSAGLLNLIFTNIYQDSASSFTLSSADGVMTLTRDNGAKAIFDFINQTLTFTDYASLFQKSFSAGSCDLVTMNIKDASGNPRYLKRIGFSQRQGQSVTLDLNAYQVPIYVKDDQGVIPLQLLSDFFLEGLGLTILDNSQNLFLITGSGVGLLSDKYFAQSTGPRSQALAEFCYHELVMNMDYLYGLKKEHHVTSFDTYFENIGYKEKLLSTDPVVFDRALKIITFGYLGDYHSGYLENSYYAGKDADLGNIQSDLPEPYLVQSKAMTQYSDARTKKLGALGSETLPFYQEVNTDTAYITFDEFKVFQDDQYYTTRPTKDSADTFGIIEYAHSQITRTDSPIKNVVIDLSCNGGGAFDAAAYLLSWVLGKGTISINNIMCNAQGSAVYQSDVNLDGTFDDKDTLANYKVYCLTSPTSFSCGNLCPFAFRSSGKVTLIGQTSGGGTCAVEHSGVADGSLFQYSSVNQISYVKNGSYYSVDQGVSPDYYLNTPESYYDRTSLATFIDKLPFNA
jgi:hypothetical protein